MEIKDRPSSLSVREWITKKISMDLIVPENVIRRVINHNYEEAYNALNKYNSIEISGFGKFYYNEKRADSVMSNCLKQLEILENSPEEDDRQNKIDYYNEKLLWLKNKKHGK